jgi:hypothetical protein
VPAPEKLLSVPANGEQAPWPARSLTKCGTIRLFSGALDAFLNDNPQSQHRVTGLLQRAAGRPMGTAALGDVRRSKTTLELRRWLAAGQPAA